MIGGAAVTAVLGLLAGQAAAAEAYPIHMTKAAAGAVILVEKQDGHAQQAEALDAAGKVLQRREEKMTDTVVYREKILTRPDRLSRPTHLQRQFLKAQREAGGRTSALPFEGKTYDIEKKQGRFRFQYAGGGALPAEAVQALEQEFNSGLNDELDWEKFVLPDRPVRVNETWDLDVPRVVRVLGRVGKLDIDPSGATARARLTQVYQQDRRRFAVVDAAVELPLRSLPQGPGRQALLPGSRITLQLQINGCIDGSAEMTAVQVTVQVQRAMAVGGPSGPGTMRLVSQSTIREVRREGAR